MSYLYLTKVGLPPGSIHIWKGDSSFKLTPGPHSVKIIIDSDNQLAESDEGNNIKTSDLTCYTVTLLSPNGGELWQKDSYQDIKWSTNIKGHMFLYLLKDGFHRMTIAKDIPASTGKYTWKVGSVIEGYVPAKDGYYILVSSPLAEDKSDGPFRITAPEPEKPTQSHIPLVVKEKEEKYVRFFLDFVDAYWIYSFSLKSDQLVATGRALSYGEDFIQCELGPFIFVRNDSWEGFYWLVNYYKKQIFLAKGGTFCVNLPETTEKLPFTVESNDDATIIRFGQYGAYLVYDPLFHTVQMEAVTNTGKKFVLIDKSKWSSCAVGHTILHIKKHLWKKFWKVDVYTKQAWEVTGGIFCKGGGSETPLPVRVRIE